VVFCFSCGNIFLDMVTTRKVRFGDGLYYSLSNYSAHEIVMNGHNWPTSEHAYQQSKFINTVGNYEIRNQIKYSDSPAKAKEIAHDNRNKYRTEWRLPSFKVYTMYGILKVKALKHEEVRRCLFSTKNREIVEINPSDSFWAGCGNNSQNWLGKCWMRVRSEIWSDLCLEFK